MLIPYKENSKHILGTLNPLQEFERESDLIKSLIKEDLDVGLSITKYIRYLESLLNGIGRELPPIELSEITEPHNIKDSAFKRELSEWIDYTFKKKEINEDNNYFDLWTLIPLSAYDYKLVSVNGNDYWCVLDDNNKPIEHSELIRLIRSYSLDTDEDLLLNVDDFEGDIGLIEDEDIVEELCNELNIKCTEATYNFPFAWNTYWVLPNYIPVELAQKAGFIAYEDNENNKTVIGIDGGGYDFYSQHWVPLYISYCQLNKHMIATEKGPRYIKV